MTTKKELEQLLYDVITLFNDLEERVEDLERTVADMNTRMVPAVLGPKYPWQYPLITYSSGDTTLRGYYTINFPKPDDDGREGIAVH